MTPRFARIALVAGFCLAAVTACSKEEAHEEAPAAESHHDLPAADPTASQDAEAAIAAAMAASPTALEAPSAAASASVAGTPQASASTHANGH